MAAPSIFKVVLDDKLYQDNIGLRNLQLFDGMVHKIKIELSPKGELPADFILRSDSDFIYLENDYLVLDLSGVKPGDYSFTLSALKEGYEERFEVKVFPHKKLSDLYGIYAYQDKKLILSEKDSFLVVNDEIDEIDKLVLTDLKFDPLSFAISCKVDSQVNSSAIEFTFYLSLRYEPVSAGIAVSLEVIASKDGLRDDYFLLGEGDSEEGIISYATFKAFCD